MNIDDIVDTYNSKLAQMQSELTEILKGAFKDIFVQAPNLHMICWAQYAPYFNDGDACEFSVNEIFAVSKSYAELENDEDHELYGEYEELPTPWRFEDDLSEFRMQEPWYGEEAKRRWREKATPDFIKEVEIVNNFLKTISSIDEDIFKSAFGDDNAVYVFADEILVEDFSGSHD